MGSGQMGGSLAPFEDTESGTRSDCWLNAAHFPFGFGYGPIASYSPYDNSSMFFEKADTQFAFDKNHDPCSKEPCFASIHIP